MREILIVDDNVALAENLAEIVGDAEVGRAHVAGSGSEALKRLEHDRFDAMVTDMRMPQMSGTELIRLAHALDPDLPVVVITAFTTDEQITEVAREGVLEVLPKPIAMAALLALLKHARRGRPVLVVEDDRAMANNLAEVLRDRGLASIIACSFAEVEQVQLAPAFALVDLRLPGCSDGAALAHLQTRFPELPMFAMSGHRDLQGPTAARRLFAKPFDPAELLAALDLVLVATTQVH